MLGSSAPSSPSPRITSRAEFVQKLGALTPRLLCALIHKFDVADLKGPPPPVQGRFYVFVDECHRTQGGDMNTQMKRWLEGAIFIGFTGTPLLRKDKRMTQDVFGTYIHTYKFHEGVADGVILDLKYEARDVPQRVTSRAAIDKWFEQKAFGAEHRLEVGDGALAEPLVPLDPLEDRVELAAHGRQLLRRLRPPRGWRRKRTQQLGDSFLGSRHRCPTCPPDALDSGFLPSSVSRGSMTSRSRARQRAIRLAIVPDGSSSSAPIVR